MSEADPFITASSKSDIFDDNNDSLFEDNDLPIDLPADNDALDQQDPSESFLSRHGFTIFKVVGICLLLAPLILPLFTGAYHVAFFFAFIYVMIGAVMGMFALLAFG